jgi:hypothetical protein
MGRLVKVGDRVLKTRFGNDAAVHPDWQRRGLHEAMRVLGVEGLGGRFDMNVGLSANPSIVRKDERDGLGSFGHTEVFERRATGELPRQPDHPGLAIREAKAFDARVDELWNVASPAFDVAAVRQASHLNWRYADPACGGFRILLAERAGALLGYAVVCVRERTGHIADLFAVPDERVLDALLRSALTLLREDATRVRAWCSERHPYRQALLRHGFTATRTLTSPRVRALRSELASTVAMTDDPARTVHLTPGDTDFV